MYIIHCELGCCGKTIHLDKMMDRFKKVTVEVMDNLIICQGYANVKVLIAQYTLFLTIIRSG